MKMKRLNIIKFLNKHITLFFMCLLLWICQPGMAQIIDFSAIDASYTHCTVGPYENPYLTPGIDPDHHSVIQTAGYFDPRLGTPEQGYFVIVPGFVKLGDTLAERKAETISYNFKVDDTCNFLKVEFFVVLQEGTHIGDQAYFQIRILDSARCVLSSTTCAVRNPDCDSVRIDPEVMGLSLLRGLEVFDITESNGTKRFCLHSFAGFNLRKYGGRVVTVEFITSDCGYSSDKEDIGHYAYAYYRAEFSRTEIIRTSQGDSIIIASVPGDFLHYQWSNGDTLSEARYPRNSTYYSCHFEPQFGCPQDWIIDSTGGGDGPTVHIIVNEFVEVCYADSEYHWHVSDTTIIIDVEHSIHTAFSCPIDSCYYQDVASYEKKIGSSDTIYYLYLARHKRDYKYKDTVCLVEGEYHNYGFDYDSLYFNMPIDTLSGQTQCGCDTNNILELLVIPPLNPGYIKYNSDTVCDLDLTLLSVYGNNQPDAYHGYKVIAPPDSLNQYVQYNWYINGRINEDYNNLDTIGHEHDISTPSPDTIMVVRTTYCEKDTLGPIYIYHNPSYSRIIRDSVKVGYLYDKNGFDPPPFYTVGTYSINSNPPISPQRYTTVHGCDSLIFLELTVYKPIEVNIFALPSQICEWDSTTLYADGSFAGRVPADCPSRPVNIGDFICEDNSIYSPAELGGRIPWGVIFYVDSSGWHGSAVGLMGYDSIRWGADDQYGFISVDSLVKYPSVITALQDVNGLSNTNIIKRPTNGSAISHPAAYKASEQEGWYLPAMGQLCQLLHSSYIVNNSLSQLGSGAVLLTDGIYWSSTECTTTLLNGITTAWAMLKVSGVTPEGSPGEIKYLPKNNYCKVRPIRDF